MKNLLFGALLLVIAASSSACPPCTLDPDCTNYHAKIILIQDCKVTLWHCGNEGGGRCVEVSCTACISAPCVTLECSAGSNCTGATTSSGQSNGTCFKSDFYHANCGSIKVKNNRTGISSCVSDTSW